MVGHKEIGCYYSSSNTCANNDVFSEIGLTSTQCSNSIVGLSDMACFIGRSCEYSYIKSKSSMTVEKCLQICTTNGYRFAGLTM